MNQQFDIPVVLILFRRKDTLRAIMERIRQVQPQRIYLLSDEGRNEHEKAQVRSVRRFVEDQIDWNCEVTKNYAEVNRGVYQNIGLGAKWVFEREQCAIFLEDDNLPEVSFFAYCKEMLEKYRDDNRILWVCGTNYLENYEPADGASYMFTEHMLPCGWASWSHKFLKYYDFTLDTVNEINARRICRRMKDKRLFKQVLNWVLLEKSKYIHTGNFLSWDYHIAWSVRVHSMYGISPAKNQIKNIGADMISEHGGNSLQKEMTRRFCGMDSMPLCFPLKHPDTVLPDVEYEKKIDRIVLLPLEFRIRTAISKFIHKALGIPLHENWKVYLKNKHS